MSNYTELNKIDPRKLERITMTKEGMESELTMFANVLGRPSFGEFLSLAVPYSDSIQRLRDRSSKFVSSSNTFTLQDIAANVPEVFCGSITAGSAEFLGGNKLITGESTVPQLLESIESQARLVTLLSVMDPREVESMYRRLRVSDTIRTIHLLKYLGLYQEPENDYLQLSLGAGNGDIEVMGMNVRPDIKVESDSFSVTTAVQSRPHVLLADNSPQVEEYYPHIEEFFDRSVLGIKVDGIVQDCSDPSTIPLPNGQKASVVTALRFAPEMIPNVETFFSGLTAVTNEKAQFVATIGSGNNTEEWNNRKRTIKKMFKYLNDKNLNPTLITQTKSHDEPVHTLNIPYTYANLWVLTCRL